MASQMSDVELEKTVAEIKISKWEKNFQAKGEVIRFEGFLKLYSESSDEESDDEDNVVLPPLTEGMMVVPVKIEAVERFGRPTARYTEASLVRKLEELGIGRPSTYAPTIYTIQKRGYVEKKVREGIEREFGILRLEKGAIIKETGKEITGADKGKLFPTDVGLIVNDFLTENFSKVLDYGFTAQIEKEFDEIAAGEKEWHQMIDTFYVPFHKDVKHTLENAERATGQRELGTDPVTGKPVFARMGRYGPMVQIGTTEDEEKPRFAKLREGQQIGTVTLADAMELFKLPRKLGSFEELEVVASIGRFGPYIQHGKKFHSITPKTGLDPYSITFEQATELISNKRTEDSQKTIREFDENGIKILRGPYGPYIKIGARNISVPKDRDPETLTLEECMTIIDKAPEKKRRFKKKA